MDNEHSARRQIDVMPESVYEVGEGEGGNPHTMVWESV
jgi:hypothetical protein